MKGRENAVTTITVGQSEPTCWEIETRGCHLNRPHQEVFACDGPEDCAINVFNRIIVPQGNVAVFRARPDQSTLGDIGDFIGQMKRQAGLRGISVTFVSPGIIGI